jgi:hypothetical protein
MSEDNFDLLRTGSRGETSENASPRCNMETMQRKDTPEGCPKV